MQWVNLYRKEMLEMGRNFKWIWVPLVFILLGVMQPVTSYYMPQILQHAGNMPEGAVIQIPLPSPAEVIMQTYSQYNTVGSLILVLSFMTILSGERISGVAGLVLVKPVSYISYVTAKWTGMATLMTVSLLLGSLASWYYTGQLIGEVPLGRLLGSFVLCGLWFLFLCTVTLCVSAMLRAAGGIAFVSLGFVIALSVATTMFSRYMQWSPSRLIGFGGNLLQTGEAGTEVWLPVIVGLALIIALIAVAIVVFRRQELAV